MRSIHCSQNDRLWQNRPPVATCHTLQTEEKTAQTKRYQREGLRRVGDRTTGSASRYWQLMRLAASGQMRIVEWPDAKVFIQRRIRAVQSDFSAQDNASTSSSSEGHTSNHVLTDSAIQILTDSAIQKKAWVIVQDPNDGDRTAALDSLRCFISYGIVQVCRQLVAQFGAEHGFSLPELLPYVLDDSGKPCHPDKLEHHYPALAIQILLSFDPSRAGLSTWVSRRVKRHSELNRFLLQQGVYLVSDWAILNDTNAAQVQRILTEFHALSSSEVAESIGLLQSYHHVYRRDRLQQVANAGLGKGSACVPPTREQLQRMVTLLEGAIASSAIATPQDMLYALRELAARLRQYRIHVRGGGLPTESLDQPESPAMAVSQPEADSDSNSNEFLTQFRQQFIESLDEALAQVVGDRLELLTRRKKGNPDGFLEALHLFHCEGMSMSDIAAALGLKAQYQVTRLLKLKEFRADVRHHLLVRLGDRLRTLAASFTSPDQIHHADAQIEAALTERIDALMTTAEAEASNARDCPMTNLFAQRLCRHLQTRSRDV